MLNSPPSHQRNANNMGIWLIVAIITAILALIFAREITQLALPGLGVPAKTVVIEPKCPTPEQKEVIERT